MRTVRNLRLSVRALAAHRVRTGLAVIGTAAGVAGVLVLTAIGEGARARILEQLDALGGDLLIVTPAQVEGRTRLVRGGTAAGRSIVPDDADALHAGSTSIRRAVPIVDGTRVVRNGSVRDAITVIGTTTEWLPVRRFEMAAGRFFSPAENHGLARVAVLGADARNALFADTTDPIGRLIRIGTVPFRVIGVLGPKGISASGTATEDDRVVIPLETAMRRLLDEDRLRMVVVEAVSPDRTGAAATDAAAILRARHELDVAGPDDFVIESQRALLEARVDSDASFRRLLFGLGALSLLVGGIGILSILLLSVRERRSEIGLRMAAGARRSDITLQFLAESLALAGGGAIAGIPAGAAVAAAVSAGTSWDARTSAFTLGVAVAAAVATGLAAGVLPAWRAATLDPVEALRSE